MPAGSKSPKISDIAITCKGVAKLLLNSNHSKAAGLDELKHRLLKKKTSKWNFSYFNYIYFCFV